MQRCESPTILEGKKRPFSIAVFTFSETKKETVFVLTMRVWEQKEGIGIGLSMLSWRFGELTESGAPWTKPPISFCLLVLCKNIRGSMLLVGKIRKTWTHQRKQIGSVARENKEEENCSESVRAAEEGKNRKIQTQQLKVE